MAFALLFDDIDPQLHGADIEAFTSFGDAQVEVTNNIYKHLGCPSFLFCPTGKFPSTVNLPFFATIYFCYIFVCNCCIAMLFVLFYCIGMLFVFSSKRLLNRVKSLSTRLLV